ncbi:MAG: P-II family nitrogen regulator [Chthoniobacter sp.]
MNLRKITAIIRSERLEDVEKQLQNAGVKGLSVSKVKGYGEYANFFTHDWMVTHARIEIFTDTDNAERIAGVIMEAAHGAGEGDGIIALLPVEKVYRIRTKQEAIAGEL